ncbi:LLM class flavin-dependent oxidoreductase, partial [bacterium]|nr:LLM class flavin-dependent oxidoreductase [bacterium]
IEGFDRSRLLDWCRRIDEGPWSSLAAGERIAFPNTEIVVTLAAAAVATERVRIFPTVVVLPLHSAVLVAKQLATLDVLSSGRLSVGLGVGGREEDYRAVGAPFERRLRRLERQVETMLATWRGEPPFEGSTPVGPAPLQVCPELLAGSMQEPSIRRAARWADGLCGFSLGPDPDEVERCFEVAREAWSAAGREAPPRLVTSCWYSLGDGARERMDAYVERYLGVFGRDVASFLAKQCRTTSAEALREVARRTAAAGGDELLLVPTGSDPSEVERAADVLAGVA